MKLLLVGATGLVGRHVLDAALADPRVARIVVIARRPLSPHPKLQAMTVDFEQLPADADWWRADAVICTLGTTMRIAGSQAAFRRVDHDYPLAVARLAHRHGTPTYVLNSALGADPASRVFYSRVKGEVERALADVGFTSLTYVRPGLIGGNRDEFRLGERALLFALRIAGALLPPKWRVNPAPHIARALLDAALDARPGVHVIASERLI
ncbi:NAD-dependent dehydratase [Burkholderia multivorans]|uniref:NAD(P)H-binding protein n=1 Tax=Burkholderia multivorans TaxID=87883 RepID=UPI00075CE756|nr:NAD(P)H-binding protein [Burkholderia multivorans]KWF72991.1 NAD-dependent dehydratase [Burkholderia multivorans]KWF79424.1 NAD-dependent dehydratase [Burkholderia multivorans]